METRLDEVRRILNTVVGNRMPNHSGKGKFWNRPRDEFVAAIVRSLPVVVPGDPAASGMVKAIRGTTPFDAPPLYRMPRNGPYMTPSRCASSISPGPMVAATTALVSASYKCPHQNLLRSTSC